MWQKVVFPRKSLAIIIIRNKYVSTEQQQYIPSMNRLVYTNTQHNTSFFIFWPDGLLNCHCYSQHLSWHSWKISHQDYTAHSRRNEFIEISYKLHSYWTAEGLGFDANKLVVLTHCNCIQIYFIAIFHVISFFVLYPTSSLNDFLTYSHSCHWIFLPVLQRFNCLGFFFFSVFLCLKNKLKSQIKKCIYCRNMCQKALIDSNVHCFLNFLTTWKACQCRRYKMRIAELIKRAIIIVVADHY